MRRTFSVAPMSVHGARCGSMARSQWLLSSHSSRSGLSARSPLFEANPGRLNGRGGRDADYPPLAVQFSFLKNQLFKKTRPKLNPTVHVSLLKLAVSHLATSGQNTFGQSVNRTKMFHVKHFGKVGAKNLTNSRHDQEALRPPQSGETIAMSESHALIVRPTH